MPERVFLDQFVLVPPSTGHSHVVPVRSTSPRLRFYFLTDSGGYEADRNLTAVAVPENVA